MRVIVPADLREPVIDVLRADVGVANLLLHPGAALLPPGDEITADIARERVNDVIKALKALDVQHRGAITLEPLDTVLSTRAHQAEDQAEGDAADAIVWDELIGRTREDATLTVTFLLFLTLACLLAAIGVINDSTVTVVGAMVVGPEFGPLAAISVALVQRRWQLARRAVIALLVGFPVAMAVTAVATRAVEAFGWLTLDTVRNIHDVDFIFDVGRMSFAVSMLAGAAGMLSLVSSKSAAMIGVFISVTTVPAAGAAVVAAVVGEWPVAWESAMQLAVNLFGIVTAGVLVLLLWPRRALIPRAAQA